MLTLKPKQKQAVDSANNPDIDTIVLIGSVGTGKTVVAAHIVISICHKFPGTEWYAWRKNNTVSRKTLIKSYKRTLRDSGFIENEDYTWHDRDLEIRFTHNGSIIAFAEADITKDPDQQKIKGIDATGSHIDEANELAEDMYEMIETRKGRSNRSGQPSLNIVTMNPNNGWAKKKYYDPYKRDQLPANVVVIEFTIKDSWQNLADIQRLYQKSKWWVQRYLMNNWDYADESGSILNSRWFAQNMTKAIDGTALRSSGLDVAIKRGGDRAVYSLWQGLTLTDIVIVKDTDEETDTAALADDLIGLNGKNAVGYQHCAVDAVGNGAGVIGSGKKLGHDFYEYVSGARPIESLSFTDKPDKDDLLPLTYDMLRSQVIHAFALGMEQGRVKMFEGCPYLEQLQNEAMEHGYEETKTQFRAESKDKIKERTGESPDIFDSVIMGFLMQIMKLKRFDFDFV
jgi:succinyl-CoA synthetase alpha subunit